MQVALIGAGGMGRRMGQNLLAKGFGLVVSDVNPAGVEPLVASGARAAEDGRRAAESSDAVVVMVREYSQVRQAAEGDAGFLAGLRAGAVVVCCSSIAPWESEALAQAVAERGAQYVDCPVSGGVTGAEGGTLTLMTAGSAEAKAAARPVLEAVGKAIYDCGEQAGQGQSMKMIVQLLVSAHIATAAEALVLARKAGLELGLVHEVMTNSNGTSKMFAEKFPLMMHEDFAARGDISIQYKDIGILSQAADRMGVPMPLTATVRQMYQWASFKGLGPQDTAAIVKVWDALD